MAWCGCDKDASVGLMELDRLRTDTAFLAEITTKEFLDSFDCVPCCDILVTACGVCCDKFKVDDPKSESKGDLWGFPQSDSTVNVSTPSGHF